MKTYPEVQYERETVMRLQRTGESLIRIGDGEIKMLKGSGNKYEAFNSDIQRALKKILNDTPENLAIAIPRPMPASPRYEWWGPHIRNLTPYLHEGITYGSSFITRPDQAPYIADSEEWFRENVAKLWDGERTMLVGSGASLVKEDFKNTSELEFFQTTGYNDFVMMDAIETAILHYKPKVLVLCAGMGVKILAPALTELDMRVYDLGSFGKRKHWSIGRKIWEDRPR